MAQVWEYIKIALMNIKSNKGRSILTMLGIIIGISSVIMIISIGNRNQGRNQSGAECHCRRSDLYLFQCNKK